MNPSYRSSVSSGEGHHLAIPWFVRLAIVWLADDEERPRLPRAMPTCPGPLALAEALFQTERVHHAGVEGECPIEVLHADEDVGEHGRTGVFVTPNVRVKPAPTVGRAGQQAQNGPQAQRLMASATRRWGSA